MMPENRMTGQTPRMMPENGMAGQMPQIMPANNGTGRLPANDATMQVPQMEIIGKITEISDGTTCRDWRAMLSVREVCREF